MQKVFISSTTRDLCLHRQAVRDIVLDQKWYPVLVNEHGGPSTNSTVKECVRELETCHLVILLVAFRRGFVPTREQDGDGESSITALELKAAHDRGIPVLIFLSDDTWPMGLSDQETEADRAWIRRFRAALNQPAGFFGNEGRGYDQGVPIPGEGFRSRIREALVKHFLATHTAPRAATPAGLEPLLGSLLPILATAPAPLPYPLRQCYRRCAPDGWAALQENLGARDLLTCAVIQLASAPRRHDNRVPLLEFLNELAPSMPGEPARQIGAWIEQGIVRLGRDEQDQQRLRAALATAPPVPPPPERVWLLVQAERAKFETGYRLKAWLLGSSQPPLRSGDAVLSREALPEEVRLLCREAEEQRPAGAELLVEFLLPRELLALDPDWWSVDDELMMAEVPLGTKHRVVIRPLERHLPNAREVRPDWERRWAVLEGQTGQPCRVSGQLPLDPPACPAVRHESPGGRPFRAQLALAPSIVCVVLVRPPAEKPDLKDLLGPILATGIPVALWLRGGAEGVQELVGRLQRTALGQVPDCVRDLRLEAEAQDDANHIGRRVALLWDDPRRLSPEADPLTSPTRLRDS